MPSARRGGDWVVDWAWDTGCRSDRLVAAPNRHNQMPPKVPLPDPETLALQALAFLAGDDDRLERFIGLTGVDPGSLRTLARDPAGLGSVLDYLLGWEPLLLEFAAAHELKPESIAVARRKLPGGENAYDPS
jgi:hypothetical protein